MRPGHRSRLSTMAARRPLRRPGEVRTDRELLERGRLRPHVSATARWRQHSGEGANPTNRITDAPGRQAEIVFAEELQPAHPSDLHRMVGRNVPGIEAGSTHPLVTALAQYPMQGQILRMIFDQNEARPPMVEVEAIENRDLEALHVDRHEIEWVRGLGVVEDVVKGLDGDRDRALMLQSGDYQAGVERRIAPAQMQLHRPLDVGTPRARAFIDPCAPFAPQLRRHVGPRLDQDSRPADYFQVPGL